MLITPIGFIIGVVAGLVLSLAVVASLGIAPPVILAAIASGIGIPAVPVIAPLTVAIAVTLVIVLYLWAYALATVSVAPALPAVIFPLAAPVPAAGPVALPNSPGENIARGMLAGLTATLNAVLLCFVPAPLSAVLPLWAFALIFIAITPGARNRVYQGFLGWSAWLFPLSYLATGVGLLLFLVNAPVALSQFGLAAIRIDFTTGVVETAGGLTGITGFSGGFSLGNFTFVVAQPVTASLGFQGSFTGPSISSHETGHTLNTAAFGGIVLWINAIDENVLPFRRLNLAYGELTAESHRMNMPGPLPGGFFVRIWA